MVLSTSRASLPAVTGTLLLATSLAAGCYMFQLYRKSSQKAIQEKSSSSSSSEPLHETEKTLKTGVPTPEAVVALIQQRRSIFVKQFTGKPVASHVIDEMLEAARWAPSHHLSQAWHFVVLETPAERQALGQLLARLYQDDCAASGKPVIAAKLEKKQKGLLAASHVIAICCALDKKTSLVEDVCSVAMAVQNMHLVATAYDTVGAYWSSAGVYDPTIPKSTPTQRTKITLGNPPALLEFLQLDPTKYVCLGWFFVGDVVISTWPQGRRAPCSVSRLGG